MAIRTYLIFKENGKEVLNTQIFGNNFWDDTFFTEISKLVGKDCFPECEEPDGAEVEVPFEEVFKLMEDVLVREIEQYQTKLVEKYDFDNYVFENTYTNPLLDFTNNFISRDDKTNEEPNETVNINISTTISSKVNFIIQFGKIFAGMRVENSNSNLADILMAHLTYSTENYEEKDAKNNFLVDPKKSDVSELDYHGYKLKVVPVKTTDGVPTGVHMFMYLDDHTCLWVKYEPETENIKDLNKEELVKLATKVLDELVTIKKK